jgi:hypothetical protein
LQPSGKSVELLSILLGIISPLEKKG